MSDASITAIVLAVITGVGVTYFVASVVSQSWVNFDDIAYFFKETATGGPHILFWGCLMLAALVAIFIGSTFFAVIFWSIVIHLLN